MVAMYQKLSFSDFISFYNSKDRHLEFLNLSPQGLISSPEKNYKSRKAKNLKIILKSKQGQLILKRHFGDFNSSKKRT